MAGRVARVDSTGVRASTARNHCLQYNADRYSIHPETQIRLQRQIRQQVDFKFNGAQQFNDCSPVQNLG